MQRASKVSKVSDATRKLRTGRGKRRRQRQERAREAREAADCAISLKVRSTFISYSMPQGPITGAGGKEQGRGHPGAYIPAWQQQATRNAQRKLQGLLAQLDEAEHDRRREAT